MHLKYKKTSSIRVFISYYRYFGAWMKNTHSDSFLPPAGHKWVVNCGLVLCYERQRGNKASLNWNKWKEILLTPACPCLFVSWVCVVVCLLDTDDGDWSNVTKYIYLSINLRYFTAVQRNLLYVYILGFYIQTYDSLKTYDANRSNSPSVFCCTEP